MLFPLQTPLRMLVCGPSQAGKTQFCLKLIKNKEQAFDSHVNEIFWCCRNKKFAPDELKNDINVKIIQGIVETDDLKPNSLIVIDDMMHLLTSDVLELFSVNSHHINCNVILILQNLFHTNKYLRSISLNASYFCLFRNPRDVSNFYFLAKQIEPNNWRNLLHCYNSVCSRPYQPFIIDLTQNAHNVLKYRTDVFNDGHFVSFATNDDLLRFCPETFQTGEYDTVHVLTI